MGLYHAVAVCPGPNLAYFSRIATLEEMVGHIYGRLQLLTDAGRPNMFINELRLNINYLKKEIEDRLNTFTARELARLKTFQANLQESIEYYKSLIPQLVRESDRYREIMREQLLEMEQELMEIIVPGTLVPVAL